MGTGRSTLTLNASAMSPYGLPELFRDQIREARLVANPGCYPTSAIVALAPLLKAGLIEPKGIIVDSKSGVSGAGRTPKLLTHYPNATRAWLPITSAGTGTLRKSNESWESPADLKWTSSSRRTLSPWTAVSCRQPTRNQSAKLQKSHCCKYLRDFYGDEPFVRVVDHLPATKDASGTNFCDVTVRLVRGRVLTISCIDNLIKGASGAAVQNFNLMYGYPETTAL